jgi:hypothetical protein|tara:strand:- start:62 stop:583 length:522 start_codon:yes stop_codon:yes gene_type:complete
MILLSNHLLTLPEFKDIKDVVIRINMAWVKDIKELHKFLDVDYDIFLDYPKGRTKPPTPTLDMNDALDMMGKYKNIKYFALSNIEDVSEVDIICDMIPNRVNFVPKIETLNGVLNLEKLFQTELINYIMLDTEDLYTDIKNDVELYVQLKKRVKKLCDKYKVKLFELYGVVFK